MIMFMSNFLYGMRGFRDNKVLLQAEYDVIVISAWVRFWRIFMTDSERATMTS